MHVSKRKAVLALLFIPAALWAGSDPLMGTWKLNLSKSTYSPGPPPTNSLNTYEPYGKDGFKYNAVQVDAHGKSLHVTFVAEYDGKDYPITGTQAATLFSPSA